MGKKIPKGEMGINPTPKNSEKVAPRPRQARFRGANPKTAYNALGDVYFLAKKRLRDRGGHLTIEILAPKLKVDPKTISGGRRCWFQRYPSREKIRQFICELFAYLGGVNTNLDLYAVALDHYMRDPKGNATHFLRDPPKPLPGPIKSKRGSKVSPEYGSIHRGNWPVPTVVCRIKTNAPDTGLPEWLSGPSQKLAPVMLPFDLLSLYALGLVGTPAFPAVTEVVKLQLQKGKPSVESCIALIDSHAQILARVLDRIFLVRFRALGIRNPRLAYQVYFGGGGSKILETVPGGYKAFWQRRGDELTFAVEYPEWSALGPPNMKRLRLDDWSLGAKPTAISLRSKLRPPQLVPQRILDLGDLYFGDDHSDD